jgi:hypothetical protein
MTVPRISGFVVLTLWLAVSPHAVMARPQDPSEKKTESPNPNNIFSGTVIERSSEKVTVSRKVLGKTEKRTFLITPSTKYEGEFKVRVWVTVRYILTDDGETAETITVREQQKKK